MKIKRKLIKKHLEDFLNNICDLKCLIKEENDLVYKLSELNKSYRSLQTILQKVEFRPVDVTEKNKQEFIKLKTNKMEIYYSIKHGVLSVNMENEALNKYIFNKLMLIDKEKQKSEIIYILNLYNNYTEGDCVCCGSYILPNEFDFPYYKQEEDGEILSFHLSCFNNYLPH